MQGPRGTKTEEIQKVIDLIDQVFRINAGLPPSMGQEFPLLLGENNKDRMRVVVDEDQPVAVVNYYKSNFSIQGVTVPVGSVGAVCTHPDYQGRGLATTLLDDVEDNMKQEGILLMLVSGRLNVYRRRLCSVAGDFYKATFYPQSRETSIDLVPYTPEYEDDMRRLYHGENLRYHRSYEEFIGFLKGGTTPWGKLQYQVYLIRENGAFSGYFVLGIAEEADHTWGKIKEYAGDRNQIIEGCYQAMKQHQLAFINLYFPAQDMIKFPMQRQEVQIEKENQVGTIKILQYTKLMDQLRAYFAQYAKQEYLDQLNYHEKEGAYYLGIGDQILKLENLDELNQFLFGVDHQDSKYSWDLQDQPALQEFCKQVLPIPMPWAGCLNFI